MNLGEIGEFWARWQPDRDALVSGDTTLSWAELDRQVREVAAGLAATGLGPGDRVGILGGNSPAWCVLALGVLRAGMIVVPLNARVTTAELAHLVDTAELGAIAVDTALRPRYAPLAADRTGVRRLDLDDLGPLRARGAGSSGGPTAGDGPGPDDPAIIAFTSGTTGYPKGAILTHANVLATVNHYVRFEGWSASTTMLCCVPLAFTGGIVSNLLITHGVGGTLLLEDFDPARVVELIPARSVTALMLVPIFYQGMTEVPGFAAADLRTLTSAVTGGAVIGEPLLRRYADKGVQIRQAYSLTEACASATLLPRSHFLTKRHTAGLPCVHTEVRVVDEHGVDAGVDEVGEIVIRGPQVSPGYWNDPGATAEAVRAGRLHTGDLGAFDADGFLRVVDRKKDMIISGGLNVYPAEVERVVGEFPGVRESAALGVPHPRWGETVALVVHTDAYLDVDALYRHCREQLSDYKVPRYLRLADEPLPRSMSGKILRRVLRAAFDPATAHRTAAT